MNVITKSTSDVIGFRDPMKFRRDLLLDLADGRACSPNKRPIISTANEALVAALMTMGDVRENRTTRRFVNTDFKWPTRNWVYIGACDVLVMYMLRPGMFNGLAT